MFSSPANTLRPGVRLRMLWSALILLVCVVIGAAPRKEAITAIEISHNRKIIATGNGDGVVRLWDVETGKLRHTLGKQKNPIGWVAFSPDDALIVTADDSDFTSESPSSIRVWDASTGRMLRSIGDVALSVDALAVSDTEPLAAAVVRGKISLLDLHSGKETAAIEAPGDIAALAFSPGGKRLAAAGREGRIHVWAFPEASSVVALPAHKEAITAIAFVDDDQIASSSDDGTINVWSVSGKAQVRSFRPGSRLVKAVDARGGVLASVHTVEVPVVSGGIKVDQEQFAAGVWESTGRERRILKTAETDFQSIRLSRDGEWLATGTSHGSIELWNARSGALVRRFAGPPSGPAAGTAPAAGLSPAASAARPVTAAGPSKDPVSVIDVSTDRGMFRPSGLWFSRNGRVLAVSGSSQVALWDLTTGARTHLWQQVSEPFALSPDGDWLAWNTAGAFAVRSTKAGEPVSFPKHPGRVTALAFAPDGATLASGSSDGSVRIWNFADRTELRLLNPHADAVEYVEFVDGGRAIVAGTKRELARCSIEGASGECTRIPAATPVAIGGDGTRLAASYSRPVLWDLERGVRTAELGTEVGSPLAFDTAGRRLAVSEGLGGKIAIWDVDAVRQIGSLPGHLANTSAAAFQPGTPIFVTATLHDNSVRVWNAETREQLAALVSANEDDWLIIAPDGRFDGPESADGLLRVGGAPAPAELVAALRTTGLFTKALSGTLPSAAVAARLANAMPSPPRIRIVAPAAGSSSSDPQEVKIQVAPGSNRITELRLLHNGRVVERDVAPPGDAASIERTFFIRPSTGRNALRAVAVSEQSDGVADLDFTFEPNARDAGRPQLVVQAGHTVSVKDILYSGDGRVIVSVAGKTLVMWDAATGRQLRSIPADREGIGVQSMAIDPSSAFVATGSSRGISVWDVATGRLVQGLAGDSDVTSILMTRTLLLAGTSQGSLLVWETPSWRPLLNARAHDRSVHGIAASADASLFVTAASDGTVKTWDSSLRQPIHTLKPATTANTIALTSDGKMLATLGKEGKVRLWNPANASLVREWDNPSGRGLAFSPGGDLLASGGAAGVSVWDVSTAAPRWVSKHGGTGALAFSPDGAAVATGSSWETNHPIRLWAAATGQEIGRMDSHARSIAMVRFGPDANQLVTMGNGVRVWDLATARLVGTREEILPPAGLDLTDDWRTLVTREKNTVVVRNGTDGKERRRFPVPECDGVAAISGCTPVVSADGSTLASAERDNTIGVWNVANGSRLRQLRIKDPDRPRDPRFPDFPVPQPFHAIGTYRLSPDGAILAATSTSVTSLEEIHLWNVRTGDRLRTLLPKSSSISSMGFSADGAVFVVGGGDGRIQAWRLATGEPLYVLEAHSDAVRSISFKPDGSMMATGSDDGTARLWRPDKGEEIVALAAVDRDDYVAALPTGHYAASRAAYKGVAFRVASSALPFEQFDAVLNRPDRVVQRLGFATPDVVKAYASARALRSKRLGLGDDEQPLDVSRLPVLSLSSVVPPVVQRKTLEFTVRVTTPAARVARLHVFVNNVPTAGAAGIEVVPGSGPELPVKVELSNGNNKIQVSAGTDNGLESLAQTFNVTYAGPPVASDTYVLAIGVSKYQQKDWNLNYAAKDAEDLTALLTERIPGAKVLKIVDDGATRDGILAAKSFLDDARVDDQVIMFVAGHGMLDADFTYYFAPHDHDFGAPRTRGISFGALEELLDGVRARRKLLLVDSCHAGEIDLRPGNSTPAQLPAKVVELPVRGFKTGGSRSVGGQESAGLLEQLFSDLRRGSGARVIAAAGGAEFAYEGTDGRPNGVFTGAVIEALSGSDADLDRDGVVRVSELKQFVGARVSELTSGRQTPTARRDDPEFDFAVLPKRER